MADSTEQLRQEMDLLNKASQVLVNTNTGLTRSFAKVTDQNNKLWTTFSRLTSGTGLWAVQNMVRGVGGAFEQYFNVQKRAEKATNDYYDGLSELVGVYNEVKNANIELSTEFQKTKATFELLEGVDAEKMALKRTQERYDKQLEALKDAKEREGALLKKALEKEAKLKERADLIVKFKEQKLLIKQDKMEVKKAKRRVKELQKIEAEFGFQPLETQFAAAQKELQKRQAALGKSKEGRFELGQQWQIGRHDKLGKMADFIMSVGRNYVTIFKSGVTIFKYGLKMMLPITMFIIGAFAAFAILKAIFEKGEIMGVIMETVMAILSGLFLALSGVMDIFSAFFGGGTFSERLGTLLKGIMKIWGGLGSILLSVGVGLLKLGIQTVAGILTLVVGGIIYFVKGLWNAITDWSAWWSRIKTWGTILFTTIWDGIWNGMIKPMIDAILNPLRTLKTSLKKMVDRFWPFASGGVSRGGMALVGERGPELVNLPAGARVYSNRQTRGMSGNTIHVNVNGRVGASDSELRDIANKIGRMINSEINRTTSSSVNMRY